MRNGQRRQGAGGRVTLPVTPADLARLPDGRIFVSGTTRTGPAVVRLSPGGATKSKSSPYESGMTPLGSTRERFSVKFYVVAILFIVFDVETVFLLPWAVQARALGWGGFAAVGIFVFILTVGLIYEWKKGALEWD